MSSDRLTDPTHSAGQTQEEALPAAPAAPLPIAMPSRRRLGFPQWIRLLASARLPTLGIIILVIIVAAAVFAPLLTPYNPSDIVAQPSLPPSPDHWFGTDHQGEDVFSQVVYGARFTLFIGLACGLVITLLAVVMGATAGYVGGWIDETLGMVTNMFLVVPQVPLLVVLAAYLQTKSVAPMIFVISITGWPWGARVLRSQTLSLRDRDFVLASVISGESTWRLILSDILPNMVSLIASTFIFAFTGSLLADVGLEFIGLGDVNTVSWGSILYWAQNNASLMTGEWWSFTFAGMAAALTIVAATFVNYGIDIISNPRLRTIKVPAVAGDPEAQTVIRRMPTTTYEPVRPADEQQPRATAPLLDIRGLVVDYATPDGHARAVDDVSFSIEPGEIFGLAGESGCGKTTVAHAIARLLKPPGRITAGQVVFQGRDILQLSPDKLRDFRWRNASIVFQSAMNSLNPVIDLGEQLTDAVLAHEQVSKREALDRAGEMFRLVGIDPARLHSYPHELSGGMRQRAAIAMALMLNPEMIIMDEPTTALDVVVQREILQEIQDLQAKFGFSILFITHDLSLLVEFSARIAIMYAGQIVELAPSSTLFHHPRHPYTVGLMSSFPPLTGEKRALTGIPGSPPSLMDPPPGCRFHARVPHTPPDNPTLYELETRVRPPLREVEPQHFVACHVYGGEHALSAARE